MGFVIFIPCIDQLRDWVFFGIENVGHKDFKLAVSRLFLNVLGTEKYGRIAKQWVLVIFNAIVQINFVLFEHLLEPTHVIASLIFSASKHISQTLFRHNRHRLKRLATIQQLRFPVWSWLWFNLYTDKWISLPFY